MIKDIFLVYSGELNSETGRLEDPTPIIGLAKKIVELNNDSFGTLTNEERYPVDGMLRIINSSGNRAIQTALVLYSNSNVKNHQVDSARQLYQPNDILAYLITRPDVLSIAFVYDSDFEMGRIGSINSILQKAYDLKESTEFYKHLSIKK